jgi:hypothetical protein
MGRGSNYFLVMLRDFNNKITSCDFDVVPQISVVVIEIHLPPVNRQALSEKNHKTVYFN